jgi:cytochrome c oxidase cbb3-type subunit 1
MFLQYGAVVSTIAVEMVVTTVILNFIGSGWGSTGRIASNLPLRWFYTGMGFYFLTCVQCAMQVTLTFQALIHFTDWVVGHAHMVMMGVFGFWILGAMVYLIPRLLGVEWAQPALNEWHFRLTAGGLLVMVVDLILGGLFQGWSWSALQPWEDSIEVSLPFWWIRLAAGLVFLAGQVCFFVNVYLTWSAGRLLRLKSGELIRAAE